jgi:hypothetical protein
MGTRQDTDCAKYSESKTKKKRGKADQDETIDALLSGPGSMRRRKTVLNVGEARKPRKFKKQEDGCG